MPYAVFEVQLLFSIVLNGERYDDIPIRLFELHKLSTIVLLSENERFMPALLLEVHVLLLILTQRQVCLQKFRGYSFHSHEI